MTKLHDEVDKLFVEIEHLDKILPEDPEQEPDASSTSLALSVAKRVRTVSTILVRALAERRDATAQEGTST